MGITKIEWCDKTWSPVTGCTPISEGCAHCWAKRMANRLRGRYGYLKDDPFKATFHPDRLDGPLCWKKPSRIFVCSMGDLFHEGVGEIEIYRIFDVMAANQNHTFLVLTKRPKRMADIIDRIDFITPDELKHLKKPGCSLSPYPSSGIFHKRKPLPNFWLGVSVENQRTADERIPILLQIPAAKRFVSVEPLLGPVDLWTYLLGELPPTYSNPEGNLRDTPLLNWVICGGETGPGARPMRPDWARSLRDQCQTASVPFFFKQMSGKQLIPKDLMVREFPGT